MSVQTRVLILAWGYSIHAKRRIQLFADDHRFSVAVASSFNYNFANAKNYLLTDARTVLSQAQTRKTLGVFIHKVKKELLRNFFLKISNDLIKGIKDLAILRSAVTEFKPDIIILQTLLYPSYIAFFLPRALPIMITFWNGDITWWAKSNGIERLLKKQIVRYGILRASAITVNSQTTMNACKEYETAATKTILIRYPGVDLERFKPREKSESRSVLGIAFSRVVLCPRGFGGYLNSDVIIEAVLPVVKRNPDTLFLFISGVGGESVWKTHLQKAKELGIERNIRWDGQVSWDLMPVYYNASDVMVSISSNDSQPNCMLEAMACGIPVIMGDIPAIHEWIVDGENGYLVPPRDAIVLADKISHVLNDFGKLTASFKKVNIEIIRREADRKINEQKIKDFVCQISNVSSSEEKAARD